jgi:hydrophobic/amphiphilic exporter-1 (mainly G- bacteria), HAE1 family
VTLSELSIRRHVLALMISVVIVLFGAIAVRDVGVDRLPNVDIPVVNVVVTMSGADPAIVDSSITSEIERAVNTVPGIDSVRSSSSPGTSVVNVAFELDKNIDTAFNEVQAKVAEVQRRLPTQADPPVISKVSFDAQPIMWLALQGDRNLQELSSFARNELRPLIENVSGVGEVRVGGGQERSIRIEIEPDRLAALGITIPELINAITSEHVQQPGGFFVSGEREDLIRLDLEYHDLLEMERLVVAERDGALIHLGDIAEIVDGLADRRSLARFNGEPAVGLGIVKVSGTNTVAIAEEVQERLQGQIVPQLPPGLSLSVAYDESVFIVEQVDALYRTIALGIFFAALVLFVFLKSLRSTVIVSLSIPVSLMAAAAVVYFFGYTLNSITMLALLLLIGVVVDDAIVVLENIYRHRKQYRRDPVSAAVSGSNEVFFAVVASSLSLIAIFGAVIFMEGMIGRFFESFAVVVTFGVLVSSLVALTLIPMLGSRFLPYSEKEGPISRFMEAGLSGMERGYRWLLGWALRWRLLTLLLGGAFLVGTVMVASDLSGEFSPEQDVGQFIVSAQTPLGSSIEYTGDRLRAVEAAISAIPEVAGYFSAVALGRGGQVNSASAFVRLAHRDGRERTQQEIMAALQERLSDIPGVRAFAAAPGMVGGGRGEPLQFVITGANLVQLGALAEAFEERLLAEREMGRVDLDLNLDLPQMALELDRDRAASLGIPAADLARTANVLIGGQNIAMYNDGNGGDGQRYDVRLKARDGTFQSPSDLDRIYLRGRGGDLVRMDAVSRFEEILGPASVTRHNLQYAANFYVAPEVPLADAVERVEELAAEALPIGYQVQFTGQAQELERTVGAVFFVLLLAVTLVYIVLASQFNSFIQPLYIMAGQPLALVGGLLGLWLGGFTLNIFSVIGMILLMGLVTKNGILLVDLTNQYREKQGMSVDEALAAACPIRLRPILMTSLTLILAMLPALIGVGAGAEANAPMAAAIVGGMVVAMMLTLLIIPAVYSLVEGFLERRGYGRRSEPAKPALKEVAAT